MCEDSDTFLCLTNTAWVAISSIATVLAVLVALFYPKYQEWNKKKNLIKIIMLELKSNIILAKKALDFRIIQKAVYITKENYIAETMKTIDLQFWENEKYFIAAYSSKEYLNWRKVNELLLKIKNNAIKICEKQGNAPETYIIENDVNSVISEYEKIYGTNYELK